MDKLVFNAHLTYFPAAEGKAQFIELGWVRAKANLLVLKEEVIQDLRYEKDTGRFATAHAWVVEVTLSEKGWPSAIAFGDMLPEEKAAGLALPGAPGKPKAKAKKGKLPA